MLAELQWLPVVAYITSTHHPVLGTNEYFTELTKQNHHENSSSQWLLARHRAKTVTQSGTFVAVWNALPPDIRKPLELLTRHLDWKQFWVCPSPHLRLARFNIRTCFIAPNWFLIISQLIGSSPTQESKAFTCREIMPKLRTQASWSMACKPKGQARQVFWI